MEIQKNNMLELETESILKLLIKYSLPAIAGMVVYSLYNVVDRIFIGQWVGADALSGLAIAFPIMNLTFALGTLVGIGGASVCSIRLGEKNMDAAQSVLGNVFLLSIVLGVGFGWITGVFLDPILIAFGASEMNLQPAHDFMQIMLIALPITFMFFNLNHIMRASGYPKKAMLSTIFSVVINVILAPIFIKILGWGMHGAAIATVCAQFVGMIWVLSHFFNSKHTLYFTFKIFKPSVGTIKSIVAIGLSPCMMNVFGCVVVILINKTLLKYGGDMAVGAYGILSGILILIAMFVIGITQGMQPIIGYNHGAGKTMRVKETLRYGIIAGTLVTIIGSMTCIVFPSVISRLFTNDETLLKMSEEALRYSCLAFTLVGPQIIIGNFFQAIGRAKLAIFLSTTRQVIFLIPLLLILPHFWGTIGVWITMPFSDFLGFTLNIILITKFLKNYSAVPADLAGEKARANG